MLWIMIAPFVVETMAGLDKSQPTSLVATPLVIDDGPPHGEAWDRGRGLGPHRAIEGFGKAGAAGE
jgi:hypothetical protein